MWMYAIKLRSVASVVRLNQWGPLWTARSATQHRVSWCWTRVITR